jgi:hypothetical protein
MRTMLALRELASDFPAAEDTCDSRLVARVTANQDFAITDGGGNSNVKKTA